MSAPTTATEAAAEADESHSTAALTDLVKLGPPEPYEPSTNEMAMLLAALIRSVNSTGNPEMFSNAMGEPGKFKELVQSIEQAMDWYRSVRQQHARLEKIFHLLRTDQLVILVAREPGAHPSNPPTVQLLVGRPMKEARRGK